MTVDLRLGLAQIPLGRILYLSPRWTVYALLRPQPFLTPRRGRQHCLNHDDGEEAHSSYRPWAVGRKSLTHIKIHAGRAFCE
jgi:hypothetical protein